MQRLFEYKHFHKGEPWDVTVSIDQISDEKFELWVECALVRQYGGRHRNDKKADIEIIAAPIAQKIIEMVILDSTQSEEF